MGRAVHGLTHGTVYSGKEILADQLRHPDQVLLTKWCLFPQMFNATGKEYIYPPTVLFATRANAKLPLYVSPVLYPISWKEDTFQHSWDDLNIYASPPFTLLGLRQILSRVLISQNLFMILVAPLWPQKECFASFLLLWWTFLFNYSAV